MREHGKHHPEERNRDIAGLYDLRDLLHQRMREINCYAAGIDTANPRSAEVLGDINKRMDFIIDHIQRHASNLEFRIIELEDKLKAEKKKVTKAVPKDRLPKKRGSKT